MDNLRCLWYSKAKYRQKGQKTMIVKVTKAEQLPICLDIIHKSFQTVAEDLAFDPGELPGAHGIYAAGKAARRL